MRPWIILAGVVLILCVIYPPFLGFVIGVVGFHLMAFIVFKSLGG